MEYKYGTAGFRYHNSIIKDIAIKIGESIAMLCSKKQSNYGLMITASHNHHEDNGVKIINSLGEMINKEDETFIENYVNSRIKLSKCIGEQTISIGYDTRESSPIISGLIVEGVRNVNSAMNVKNYYTISTPQLHDILFLKENKYIDNLCKLFNTDQKIIVDCANGVGSIILNKVIKKSTNINCINNKIDKYEKLNNNCGSEYVTNNQILSSSIYYKDYLYASLDGDADRVIFYFFNSNNNNKICILNGDKISALIALYLSKKIKTKNKIAFIHTGYSNNAFLEYINKLGFETICTASGVKNLHKEAKKYDIGVYFEPNGHGTVLFNKEIDTFKELKNFFSQVIGDGIMNIAAILFILEELNISIYEWYNLYEDFSFKSSKVKVFDKSLFKTTDNELKLTKPEILQEYIDTTCDHDTRSFVRPSGTENCLRIYVESKKSTIVDTCLDLIKTFIINHYLEEEILSNGRLYKISSLKKEDINHNYIKLLNQLSNTCQYKVNCKLIDNFYSSLNNNHIIKVIKNKHDLVIVGTVTIIKEHKILHNFGKVGHIEDVVVDKRLRGSGLGKKLIEIAKKECEDCYKIILNCSDDNIDFYKKCGFEKKQNQMVIYK